MSSNIDKGFVIISADEDGRDAGHTWIADGYHKCKYKKISMKTTDYYVSLDGQRGWEVISSEEFIESTIHMNWGWHGLDNGYFAGEVFELERIDNNLVFRNPQFILIK